MRITIQDQGWCLLALILLKDRQKDSGLHWKTNGVSSPERVAMAFGNALGNINFRGTLETLTEERKCCDMSIKRTSG